MLYRGIQNILKKIHLPTALVFITVLVAVLFFSFEPTVFAQEGSGGDNNPLAGFADGVFRAFLEGSGKFIAYVLLFISSILASFLSTVSYLFNTAMLLTVFRFADYFGNSDGLLLAWTILRDIANIVLLFGFVFMGIATILDVDLHRYNAKKAIPMLVIFAILLNFSLFAAEAIVDVANSVSASFYTQAAGGVDCSTDEGIQTCAEDGLAGKIVQATGLAGILNFENIFSSYRSIWNADGAEGGLRAAVLFFVLFMLVVTVIIVLLAATVMLVSRAIVLAIVFITSPIGFAGMAIPPLQGLSKQWWDALINNALFAPVFVLLILVGLTILEGLYTALGVTTDQNLLSVLLSDDPQAGVLTGNVFVMFAFAIGFFIAALLIAQHLGLAGSKAVVGSANKWMGRAAGFGAFGLPALAYRQTAGRAIDATSRFARRAGLPVVPIIGKPLSQMLDYGATASGDFRGTGMAGDRFGKTDDFSKAAKKGYRGVAKAAGEDRDERAGSVVKARKEWIDERTARANAMQSDIDNARTDAEREKLQKKKDRYDARTQKAFQKFASSEERKKFEEDQKRYFELQADRREAAKDGDKDRTEELTKQIGELGKKLGKGQTDAFLQRYADSMAEMADILRFVGYDIRGMRMATSSINKTLGKSSNDKLMDDLKKALSDKGEEKK